MPTHGPPQDLRRTSCEMMLEKKWSCNFFKNNLRNQFALLFANYSKGGTHTIANGGNKFLC